MDHADLHGKLSIQAIVSPAGRVVSTSITHPIEGGTRLQACVTSSMQSWTFPPPAGGVNGTINRTFVVVE
jgi:hypothetical protein